METAQFKIVGLTTKTCSKSYKVSPTSEVSKSTQLSWTQQAIKHLKENFRRCNKFFISLLLSLQASSTPLQASSTLFKHQALCKHCSTERACAIAIQKEFNDLGSDSQFWLHKNLCCVESPLWYRVFWLHERLLVKDDNPLEAASVRISGERLSKGLAVRSMMRQATAR